MKTLKKRRVSCNLHKLHIQIVFSKIDQEPRYVKKRNVKWMDGKQSHNFIFVLTKVPSISRKFVTNNEIRLQKIVSLKMINPRTQVLAGLLTFFFVFYVGSCTITKPS